MRLESNGFLIWSILIDDDRLLLPAFKAYSTNRSGRLISLREAGEGKRETVRVLTGTILNVIDSFE